MLQRKYKVTEKGSGVTSVLIAAAAIVFLIIPVFSAVVERYILLIKLQIIEDAVDLTNSSVYNALNSNKLGKNIVAFDEDVVKSLYIRVLAKNMKLDLDLNPIENSIADHKVTIESIEIYTDDIPTVCPYGTNVTRPMIHSCIIVPVKPTLYMEKILSIVGKESFQLKIHVDSDIPINN